MNLIRSVHSEGDAIQALGTDNTCEAVGMIRLPCKAIILRYFFFFSVFLFITCGPEDSVEDGLETLAAPLQGVEITRLAVRLTLNSVEWKTL